MCVQLGVRKTFLVVGLILLVAGLIMFLAYNPSYISLSNRFLEYETPDLNKSEFEHYNLIRTTIMPILNILIAIGVTLLLLGALTKEKEQV